MPDTTPTGFGDRLLAALRRSLVGMAAMTALLAAAGHSAGAPGDRSDDGERAGAAASGPGPAVRYRRLLFRVRSLEAVVRRSERGLPEAREDRRRARAALMARVREIHRHRRPSTLMLLLGGQSVSGALALSDALDRLVAQDVWLVRALDRTRRRIAGLHARKRAALRRARGALREIALQVPGVRHSPLAAIAYCESTNNPRAISPDGRYRGKYQFDLATWRTVGGTGDPARAPEGEQDRRAALLYQRRGSQPWPVCGLLFRGVGVEETAFSAVPG